MQENYGKEVKLVSTSDKNKEIGRRIKQLGIDHGYSVQKIAQDNHISYDTMSRVNRGIGISKEKVEMFAKYYDVSTDFILTGKESIKTEEPTKEFYIKVLQGLSVDDLRKLYNIGKEVEIIV